MTDPYQNIGDQQWDDGPNGGVEGDEEDYSIPSSPSGTSMLYPTSQLSSPTHMSTFGADHDDADDADDMDDVLSSDEVDGPSDPPDILEDDVLFSVAAQVPLVAPHVRERRRRAGRSAGGGAGGGAGSDDDNGDDDDGEETGQGALGPLSSETGEDGAETGASLGRARTPAERAEAMMRLSAFLTAPSSFMPESEAHLLDHEATSQLGGTEVDQRVIWGTTVQINQTWTHFKRFFIEFTTEENPDDPLYPTILEQMHSRGVNNLNLDCSNLSKWDELEDTSLYRHIVNYPQEVVPLVDLVVNEIYRISFNLDQDTPHVIQVRPFNLLSIKKMRDLNPIDIDKLISVNGMVTRTSPVVPGLNQAFFECQLCKNTVEVPVNRGRIAEPTTCSNCSTKGSMTMVHNRCKFFDQQIIRLQETPDAIPEGETPQTISACAYDQLVDVARPGDRVTITGIFRALPVRANPARRVIKSIYRTFFDVLHLQKIESGRLGIEDPIEGEDGEYVATFHESDQVAAQAAEKERNLWQLAQSPDIYTKLVKSFAPSIWEMDDIKKGVLCQLFGGTPKRFNEASTGRFRGEINILLCGDPGTSKSQLLQYVHKIAPRGIYTSGKGSSAVGLTAYITKDPDTNQAVLESGALVLSDRGICCIDEFDKMTDHTRTILHEAMEQQTVSVAKAGIICTLNARTSVLASANPVESRYNPRLSVVDNIQLPPTLLSRFDLIYLVLDKPSPATDQRLARHIISMYYENPDPRPEGLLDVQTLTDYIAYARRKINPVLSDEAAVDLVTGYVEMRKLGGGKKTITATPRQLESLIRISEAHARMRFSQVVERADVQEALRLVRVALQQAALDPRTGTIDMDLITTGRSRESRGRVEELARELREIVLGHESPSLSFRDLYRKISEQSSVEISRAEMQDAVHVLEEQGVVAITGDPRNPRLRRTT